MIFKNFKIFVILLFLNIKLSKSQNLYGLKPNLNPIISENLPQIIKNPTSPYYIVRKDNLVIGPIPGPFSLFFINQGYFGYDPNNPGGTSANSGGESGNFGDSEIGGKSNSEGDKSNKMRNNGNFPRFSTTPKSPTNPATELTPPKMEDSQISRPNQPENFQPRPPEILPDPLFVPDPPIVNEFQIVLLMATFLGGLLVGLAPLIVTQILLNASMVLLQAMELFQPMPTTTTTTVATTTIHMSPVSSSAMPAIGPPPIVP